MRLVWAAGAEAAMSTVVIDVDRVPCLVGQSGRDVTNNPLACAGHHLEPIPRSLAPMGRGSSDWWSAPGWSRWRLAS